LKGWVELEFEDGTSCRLEAGDSCFIPGGMRHNEIGTSDDLEILEVCLPADMGTVPVDPPAVRPNGS
jgi:mannose-6-phosphate isomerase-like protein (cupin superfamily)